MPPNGRKQPFLKVEFNEFLQFDLTEKFRRDRVLTSFSTLCSKNVDFTEFLVKIREITYGNSLSRIFGKNSVKVINSFTE